MFGQSQGQGSGINSNNWGSSIGFGQANTSNSAGGNSLFGNSLSKPDNNLFDSSNKTLPKTGLFGNSNNTVNSTTSNNSLFNNSSTAPTTSNTTSTGLFGSQKPATSNLFGTTSQPSGTSNTNLFGQNSNNAASNMFSGNNTSGSKISANPYSYNTIFNTIQNEITELPSSITENLFTRNAEEESAKRKRKFSEKVEEDNSTVKSRLLSKLGQTLNFAKLFGSSSIRENKQKYKGIFTSSDVSHLNSSNGINPIKSEPTKSVKKSIPNDHGFKKLVIKSKPSKFHLIDADSVISTKRRRIVSSNAEPTRLIVDNYSSDESGDEKDTNTTEHFDSNLRFHYKRPGARQEKDGSHDINGNATNEKSKIIESRMGEYWTTPPIEELSKLPVDKLTSIENFIIGRIGYGQIVFNYPVDLSSLELASRESGTSLADELFGRIVVIEKKVVKVYHNVDNKPPIGFGLNIPATITLENIGPKPNQTPSALISYLRQLQGMEFITYDPITSMWTFKVKHFSIWGLVDDEYAEQEEATKSFNGNTSSQKFQKAPDSPYQNEEYTKELKKQKVSNYTFGLPGGWGTSPNDSKAPINIKWNLVDNEINNQLALYNQEKTANTLAENISDITIDSDDQNTRSSDESLDLVEHKGDEIKSESQTRNYDYLKQLISVLPTGVNISDIVNEKAYEPNITNDGVFDNIQLKPDLPISDDWLVQLELCNDINSALNTRYADKVNNIDSSKLTSSTVDKMIFPRSSTNDIVENTSTPSHGDRVSKKSTFPEYTPSKLKSISLVLDLLLKNSSITTRENEFPKVEKMGDVKFNTLATIPSLETEDKQVFCLASGLFDEQSPDIATNDESTLDKHVVDHLKHLQQRNIFSQWLKEYNHSLVDNILRTSITDPLKCVFWKVCAGDIKGAVASAIDAKSNHLSVLLTLLDSNDDAVKSIAKNQFDHWKDSDSLHLVPPYVLHVYRILSGHIHEIPDLPWNISLALKVYYGGQGTSLSELLQYINASKVDNELIYNILELYNSINAASPEKIGPAIHDSNIDTTYKWLFSKLLSSQTSESLLSDYSLELGKILESKGLFKEAAFVYMHIGNDKQNEEAIRGLVIQNIDELSNSIQYEDSKIFQDTLKIPDALIFEAFATRRHKNGDFWTETEFLIEAKLWEKAHESLINDLAPQVVISNNKQLINRFLELTSRFPESGNVVVSWSQGAGIYVNYLNLIKGDSQISSTESQLQLDFLLNNLPLVKTNGSKESKIALSVINKRVGDLALGIFKHIDNIKSKITSLKLSSIDREYFNIRLNSLNLP
ncbi:Piso0_004844 [Millerozyma farinosa CBS 7064]|uniref:Piso0_004844 protein n=1 Tax=Pichia sorbitophila (strain ATCC MYA-4447 / BCRC 22081 / CBS 7064 / NBRC 10061 / NRRL Y-12695) TaxID=559304 RepID=G8Y3J4_PICSO|nr:Piso0_004844 [Millerozyma farinosa CBS 7064]